MLEQVPEQFTQLDYIIYLQVKVIGWAMNMAHPMEKEKLEPFTRMC